MGGFAHSDQVPVSSITSGWRGPRLFSSFCLSSRSLSCCRHTAYGLPPASAKSCDYTTLFRIGLNMQIFKTNSVIAVGTFAQAIHYNVLLSDTIRDLLPCAVYTHFDNAKAVCRFVHIIQKKYGCQTEV